MAGIDPQGGAKAFTDSMSVMMRMKSEQLAQREKLAAAQQKAFDMIKELNDALAEQDPAMRKARLNEAATAVGLNPRDPTIKMRIETLTKADETTRSMMRRRASGIATEATPQEINKMFEGILGTTPLADIEKQAGQLQQRKLLKRLDRGEPSVGVAPSPALGGLQTGRVGGGTVPPGIPETPPMAAPGPVTATTPGRALGTPANPQPRGALSPDQPLIAPGKGVGMDFLNNVAGRESGNRADARAPTSSATGKYQYTDSTWLSSVKRYKPDWAQGLGPDEILAARTNPQFQDDIMTKDTAHNTAVLERNGFQGTPANLYAMHHFGPAGAGALLQADPNAEVTDVLPRGVIKANPYLKDHTVGSLLRSFDILGGKDDTASAAEPVKVASADPNAPIPVKTETIAGVPNSGQPQADAPAPKVAEMDPSRNPDTLRQVARGLRGLGTAEANASAAALEKQAEDFDKRAGDPQTRQRAGKTIGTALGNVAGLENTFGDRAAERALGPMQATSHTAGEGGSYVSIWNKISTTLPRLWSEIDAHMFGGASPTEVRDAVESWGAQISGTMKPLVRGAGEGVWSDSDQAHLDQEVDGLARARDKGDRLRRIGRIQEYIENRTGMQLDVQPAQRKAGDPVSAENETTAFETESAANASRASQAQQYVTDSVQGAASNARGLANSVVEAPGNAINALTSGFQAMSPEERKEALIQLMGFM